jgi:hypothetical protein
VTAAAKPAAKVDQPPAPRRLVTPATEATSTGKGYEAADVFYTFRGVIDAATYWLPANLNRSVTKARALRQIVR